MKRSKKKGAKRKVTTNKSEAVVEPSEQQPVELPYELTLSQTEDYFFGNDQRVNEFNKYQQGVAVRNAYYTKQGLYTPDLIDRARGLVKTLKADTALTDLELQIKQLQEEHDLLSKLTSDKSGKASYGYLLQHPLDHTHSNAFWTSLGNQAQKYLLVKVNDFNKDSNFMQVLPNDKGTAISVQDKSPLAELNRNYMGTILGLQNVGVTLNLEVSLATWYRKTLVNLYRTGKPDYSQLFKDIINTNFDHEVYELSLQEYRQLTDFDLMTSAERKDFEDRLTGKIKAKGATDTEFRSAYNRRVGELKDDIYRLSYQMGMTSRILENNGGEGSFDDKVEADLQRLGTLVTDLTGEPMNFGQLTTPMEPVQPATTTPEPTMPSELDLDRVSDVKPVDIKVAEPVNPVDTVKTPEQPSEDDSVNLGELANELDDVKETEPAQVTEPSEPVASVKESAPAQVVDATNEGTQPAVDTAMTPEQPVEQGLDNPTVTSNNKADTIKVTTNKSTAYVEEADLDSKHETKVEPSGDINGVNSFTLDDLKHLNEN